MCHKKIHVYDFRFPRFQKKCHLDMKITVYSISSIIYSNRLTDDRIDKFCSTAGEFSKEAKMEVAQSEEVGKHHPRKIKRGPFQPEPR